jgi:alpha-beta hydrolase superfamily lysophospholipase
VVDERPQILKVGRDSIEALYGNVGPASIVAVMAHGGPGGNLHGPSGFFDALVPRLLGDGVSTFRFSFRGSGGSTCASGVSASVSDGIEDFRAVVKHVRSLHKGEIVVVAESMGVTMSVLGAERHYSDISRWALLWPALNLFDTDLRTYLDAETMSSVRKSGLLDDPQSGLKLSRSFLEECLILDAGDALSKISFSDVLIMHGDADQEVPLSHSLRAHAIVGSTGRLEVVPGGGHTLPQPHERALVIERVRAFMKRA